MNDQREEASMAEDVEPDRGRTVGPREGLGAGIVGLGILLIALPVAVADQPAAQAALTLAGMMVLMGVFVIIAGVASFLIKD
ncbi:MAG: hypothetical protein WCK58_04155 [Chloroflexota bacterium]